MATVQFKIKVSEAGALGLFGQSTGDAFDVYNESADGVLFGSTSQKKSYVEVVAVAKDATHYPSTIYTYSGTISKKVDGYWHTQWTGNNTGSSPSSVTAATKTYTKSTFPVTVVDEHGTHLGTPNCSGIYFLNEAYIGLLHQSAASGYTFTGWTITITRTNSTAQAKPTFASSETGITSEESGLDLMYTVPASYEGAVIFKPSIYYTSAIVVKANYTKDKVTKVVSWMKNSAELFASTTCTVGEAWVFPDGTPTNGSLVFAGWYTAAVGGTQIVEGAEFADSSPTTVYAQWTAAVVVRTVSWLVDGVTFATTSCTVGEAFVLPASNPTKDGYTFIGWFDAESGGTQVTADVTYVESSPTSVYAQWEGQSRLVSWIVDGATFATTLCTVGSAYEIPSSSPTKDGYVFSGWFDAESGGGQITSATDFTASSPVTAYAQWKSASIRLPFCVAEGAVGKVVLFAGQIVNGTVFLNQPATTSSSVVFSASAANGGVLAVAYIQVSPLSAKPKCSKVNSGTMNGEWPGLYSLWTGNEPTGAANEISITGSSYSGNTYSVTIQDEHGEHIGTQNCENVSFWNGSTIGVKHTTTNRGWKFTGWRFKGTTPNSSPLPLSNYWTEVSKTEYFLPASVDVALVHQISGASVTIIAEYEAVDVSVAWLVDGVLFATTTCVVGGAYVFPTETPSKSGYTFVGWFTAASGGDKITEETMFTETSSVMLYAQWSTAPTPEPSGGGTGLMVRSATSDFLVFSVASGALVYDA